jgi:hypothetical protein
MNLADKLVARSSGAFPLFPSPLGFFPDLNGFAEIHFSNFKSVEVFNGLTIYAGSPEEDEITTDAYVDELDGVYYTDKNRNDLYDRDSDLKLASIKVFITHDGAFLLKKYNALKGQIKDDEIALFLEYNEHDVISDAVTLVLAGNKVKKYVVEILKSDFVQDKYFIGPDKQKELVETVIASNSMVDAALSIFIKLQDAIIEKVTEIGVGFFGEIESFFSETLRIPDKFWNVEAEGSIMGGLGNLIEKQLSSVSKQINAFVTEYENLLPLQVQIMLLGIEELAKYALEIFKGTRLIGEFFIALVCGIWNAIMDTIAGIFGLVKLVIQGISGIAKMANGAINYASHSDYYNSLVLEYLDNLLAEAIKIDWKEVIEIATLMIRLPVLIWDKITELNHTEVGYYVGYLLFEIVSFIFPPIKLAELGKLAKWTRFGKIREVSKVIPEGAVSKAVNKADEFFEFIQPLIKKLKAGTKEFKEFVRDILHKFRVWIEEVFGVTFKTLEKKEIDWIERKTTGNFGGKLVTIKQIKRLKKILRDEYGIELIYEGSTTVKQKFKSIGNFKTSKELFNFMKKENKVGGFHAPTRQMILPKETTEIVVFHEQAHMKHWSLIGDKVYQETSTLVKEMYVWEQIYKSKALWNKEELAASLKYINDIRVYQYGLDPIIL